ncbi:aminotransferase class V-fold PLP-dependent enzyme [Algisphaera agarilytica]|uniref:cysteine desulfurase n=1 Tax=Algisphaera agarilytica TaxID=1385975 RepID=A0A7X0H8V3_9BACT|nr:aminotransferase class V-fold PLP-dependent enzyme [Algisphaera agarilytica]MBB6431427.1 cysteine desulfurase family protein [Algisphaera agarilytica]
MNDLNSAASNPPRRIYLDNAATSFPKPPCVLEAMNHYATQLGASPGRGAYAEAREATALFVECRSRINTLLNGESPDHVVFTLNTTDALNLAIHGLIHPQAKRRHVVTCHLDHNSVLRPFNELVSQGVATQTRVECDPRTGRVDPADIKAAIRPDTGLVAIVHGSNVTGTLQPIYEIGQICRESAVPFLVDAAQTAGHVPLDVQRDNIDLLAAPGHKSLLGPLGTGFLYIRPGIENMMRTVREGGTGSVSELDVQPTFMPDRFEPGSHNAPGIVGLNAALGWILDQTVEKLWAHDRKLTETMIDGLHDTASMPGFSCVGPQGIKYRCGVFSVRIDSEDGRFADPNALAQALEQDYGILTRAGIHCAPLAHQTVGTHALGGTTRLSFGPFVTAQDVKYACDALAQLCESAAAHAVSS